MAQALRADEYLHRVIDSNDCYECSPTCPPMPAPDRHFANSNDVPRKRGSSKTVFLEEEDHRHEERIESSRTKF